MNAVIVDIRKKQAAALDESGRVVRIRNNGYEIGQQIELHEVRPVRSARAVKRFSSGVAAAVLAAVIGTGTAYAMPYGTVTLEGEPSVEYTINCFDYVLGVQAENAEGEALLAEMDLRQLCHHQVDRAVTATMKQLELDGYMENTEVAIQISAETRNDRHTQRLQQELRSAAERTDSPAGLNGERTDPVPENAAASFRPEDPAVELPKNEAVGESPADRDTPAHLPGSAYPDAGSESGKPFPDGADEGLQPPKDGSNKNAAADGSGLMPGVSAQPSDGLIPERDRPGQAS